MTRGYRLYYWPGLPGRGELVRVVLEDAGAPYEDVARLPEAEGGGVTAVLPFYEGRAPGHPIFAPPVLVVDEELVLAQTPTICLFLGRRHGLCPADEPGWLHANQLQLTLSDLVDEVHQTHHPIAVSLYYEDQKEAALACARAFREQRLPKYVRYFERVLQHNGGDVLVGDAVSYVDLTLFQLLCGLEYAFPRAMAQLAPEVPGLLALRDRVAARPKLAAYLASPRRMAFNEDGIFRCYPELDGAI